MINFYIDIDGVLINDSLVENGNPVPYALEFLKLVTEKFNCYWLTTHCMNGENHAPEYLTKRIPEAAEYIAKIKPTNWSSWKTEAIDFNSDFRWIDDDVYKPEEDTLASHNAIGKIIRVNLRDNPRQLKDITEELSNLITSQLL